MNTIKLIAIAATTLAASLGASAQTYTNPQETNGRTTRAEVQAELRQALANDALSRGEFSYVAPPAALSKSRDAVRAELAAAQANEELARGEFAYAAAAPTAQPKTRDQVRAELAEALANDELARGEFAYRAQPDEQLQGAFAQGGVRRSVQ